VARELTYLDFDVLLERGEQDTYWARVINAPAGQTPPIIFTLPFTPLELENFVLRIGRPRRGVRRIDAPETTAIKTFGGRLYRALFKDDLQVNLLRSLSEAAALGAGLRIRLRLSDTPELAELPWEFLYDHTRNRFLCLSERTPLVRFLEVPDPPRPLTFSPPLQVLVMIASPSDYPQLDVEQEWAKLRTALAPLEQASQVQVTRLETATLAALRQQLRHADWHILHFIGHGGFDSQTQDGVLVLEDQAGRSRLVSGQDLGVLLHDHQPLRLVVLNACEGARVDPSDPFAGSAQSLIQQGIPAVVAMQFEITDPAAISFSSEFYAAIADGYPLDAALAEARKAIWTDGNQVEWATPVLHLRAPDGRIFNIVHSPATASPPSTAASTAPASSVTPPPRATEPESTETGSTAETTTPMSAAPTSPSPARAVRAVDSANFVLEPHEVQVLRHDRSVNAVAFSPNGRLVATASDDWSARVWEVASGQERLRVRHNDAVSGVAFSPGGRLLATASYDHTARVWEVASGQERLRVRHRRWVRGVAFSPDGRLLATTGYDYTARVWKVPSGQERLRVNHDDAMWGVAFSPDGRLLATASSDRTARVWEVAGGQERLRVNHNDQVLEVAFSPDGRLLVTASEDDAAHVWALVR
jgi:hypothetical protein